MTDSTSRATFTRKSSQMRRGRAFSSTTARGSSETSPSIQRRIESMILTVFVTSPRDKYLRLSFQKIAIDPASVFRVGVGLLAPVLDDLHLIPLAAHLQDAHGRADLGHADLRVARVGALAQVYIGRRHKFTPRDSRFGRGRARLLLPLLLRRAAPAEIGRAHV